MKFATQQWVRTKEMRITQIINEYPTHPEFLAHHCAGCHVALAGKPWGAVWAEKPRGQGGAYKLCAACTEEARQEIAKEPQS